MYTRCPSCRSEISFQAPANINELPDGYKHRIKCPNCGVTIGVKIPRPTAVAQPQPTYTPQYPQATSAEPIYQAQPAAPVAAEPVYQAQPAAAVYAQGTPARVKPAKKSGRGRNFVILLISLAFVALAVVGYLITDGVITAPEELGWVGSIKIFDAITLLSDIDSLQAIFEFDIATGIIAILPVILFLMAALNAAVAFISLIGGKYGRAWNFISGIIIAAAAICLMFQDMLLGLTGMLPEVDIVSYFQGLIERQEYFAFVSAALGAVQLLFSLAFLKSLKRKQR